MSPKYILDGGRDEQILLFESQLLSRIGRIVGVQNAGNVLGTLSGFKSVVVLASVEGVEVKLIEGERFPESEADGVEGGISGYRSVVGPGDDGLAILPEGALYPFSIRGFTDTTVEAHFVLDVNSLYLPRVAITEPKIGHLYLVTLLDDLFEDTVVITNAVAPSGVVESGH
jgi:hypothetical protein